MPSFLLAILLQINGAIAYWLYESLNVTQWQWQSSVVVNDWLYIDGGELYATQNGKPTFFYYTPVGQTISIDLSQPWTNSTVQKYSIDTQRSITDGHWSKRPSLFYDTSNDQVIQWGGWPYANGDLSYSFSFTPNSHGTVNWYKNDTPITNDVDQTSPAIFGGAFVASNSSFYCLGGNVAEASTNPYIAVQGLVEYDFASNKWTNTSSLSATSNGYLVGGQAAFTADFGQAGYLVFVGGSDPNTQMFDVDGAPLVDMSTVTLYDIGAKAWYHQTTTGTIPPPRQFFCSVGGSSVQDTFEIFILGGSTNSTFDSNNSEDDGYLNVFTLSIPAFRWFKSADSDQVRRADHSCQVIGNRQMLVIGGTQPSNSLGIAAVDPWPSGLGIFDMTAFAWSDGYDPSAAVYEQPDVVRDYYTYSYQAPEWGAAALEPIFAWSPPSQPTGSSSTPAAASPTPSSTSGASGSTANPSITSTTSHTGAIVGGVVGGVGGIVLVGLAYLLVRWKRLGQEEQPPTTTKDDNEKGDVKTFSRHELESPEPQYSELGSPVPELPPKEEVETENPVLELPADDIAATNTGVHRIRRKPVAELP